MVKKPAETKRTAERPAFTERNSPRAMIDRIARCDRVAIGGLLAANLIPIVLTVLFGWSLRDVVIFYWWENIVVGFYAILRILLARGGRAVTPAPRIVLVPFFTFHYFFFCLVHISILRHLFPEDGGLSWQAHSRSLFGMAGDLTELLPEAGWFGLLALAVSHGVSFVKNYLMGGEYRRSAPGREMFRPYGRIVVLHVCIIFGALAITAFGSPFAMVLLLMVAKTVLDLLSHCVSHALVGPARRHDMQ